MTFQHTGHGCLGVGGILGAFGVHLPDPPHFNLPHPNLPHFDPPTHHDFGGHDGGGLGGLTHHAGESLGLPADPLQLVFGNPALASSEHAFSLAAIPVGGGITMSIVALIAVLCMVLIMASMMVRTVAVRTAGTKCSR
jgi:hypothetical protein